VEFSREVEIPIRSIGVKKTRSRHRLSVRRWNLRLGRWIRGKGAIYDLPDGGTNRRPPFHRLSVEQVDPTARGLEEGQGDK
jgi:hypothetical protein